MKTLYLIKHAKSNWSIPDTRDFERPISRKGKKDIKTIGSYLSLRGVVPDIILSSCSLRAQESADLLGEKIGFSGKKEYLQELYMSTAEELKDIVMAQDDSIESIFIVAHNPQLSELINMISAEHFSKIPSMGVVALKFDINEWSEIQNKHAEVDFFIFPKQFKYYMPRNIRDKLI